MKSLRQIVDSNLAGIDAGAEVQAGGPGSGRHPGFGTGRNKPGQPHNYVLQVHYKGAVDNARKQGYEYTKKDFDARQIPDREKHIASTIAKFGGKHTEQANGSIFSNRVYHTARFQDEDSMRKAHAAFKDHGGYKMEMQRRGGHFKVL